MSFLIHTFSIFIISFCSAFCIQQEQSSFVVTCNNNSSEKTIYYSNDKNNNVVSEQGYATLFFNGLVSVECAKRFHHIRSKPEYKNQYPGQYVSSNGPVNNRDAQYNAFLRWLGNIPLFKSSLRVCGALPYAFNYEEEATHAIKLLQYLNKKELPTNQEQIDGDIPNQFKIGCLQAICYGFHGIVCGVHALVSSDQKAQQIRKKLGLKKDKAKQLLDSVSLIIAQAPMMRIADPVECITRRTIPCILFVMQLSFLVLTMWLDHRQNILHKNTIALLYVLPLLINIVQCCPIAKEKMVAGITFFIIQYVMPFVAPHTSDYEGDLTNLLQNLQLDNNFSNLTLVVTHQEDDEFVGPLKKDDKELLKRIFPQVIFVPSCKNGHLYESEKQKAVQNKIRKEKCLPYCDDSLLLKLGEHWLKNNYQKHSSSPVKSAIS